MSRGHVVFVIGVAASGKSTVAEGLAGRGGAVFLEGDKFHSDENIEHMRSGLPLTDEMRWGWLTNLAEAARAEAEAGRDVFVACSALKRIYRDLLRDRTGPCRMLFLDGDRNLILSRLVARVDHYMPPTLLDSQMATLERPGRDEPDVLHLGADQDRAAMIDTAARMLSEAK